MEEDAELRRLNAGLFTLQRLDLCLGKLLTEPAYLREKIEPDAGKAEGGEKKGGAALSLSETVAFSLREKLHEQGGTIVDIVEGLSDYAESLPQSAAGERQEVLEMMQKLAAEGGLLE